jgi:hypothetical protein
MDATTAMSYAFGPKDEQEINTIKKACQVSSDLYNKYLKDQIMDIIDSEKVLFLAILFGFSHWHSFQLCRKFDIQNCLRARS